MLYRIEKDKCVGCGNCISICPRCFELDTDYKAYICKEYENEDELKEMGVACSECPNDAILMNI